MLQIYSTLDTIVFSKEDIYKVVKNIDPKKTYSHDMISINSTLDTFVFTKEDIYKVIKNLDPSKAYSHEMISIQMLKLCCIFICKSLEIIFQNCLRSNNFFYHKTPNKQMLAIFQTNLGKSLIWKNSSWTWESDFKIPLYGFVFCAIFKIFHLWAQYVRLKRIPRSPPLSYLTHLEAINPSFLTIIKLSSS